jgi:hypothetical protein
MRLTIRFPDDNETLHARVERAAMEDRRSMNAEILWLIEWALDHHPERAAQHPEQEGNDAT